jgi:hypothetical protein
MIPPTRASLTTKIAVCVASLACACLLPTAVAAAAESTVTYQKESFTEYEKQLAGAQIQSVTINKRVRSLRITLKDGRYVLAKYAPHEEPKIAVALQAKGVPVTLLQPAEVTKEASAKPVHHKLRYIAGGILVVVIVVVGIVLYVDRKRKRALE